MPALCAHPLITDDTGTQGKGKFQLEFNGEYGHENEDSVVEDATEAAAALTCGINDQIDVSTGIPYRYMRKEDSGTTTENGISDTALALKWRFYEKEGLSFALKPKDLKIVANVGMERNPGKCSDSDPAFILGGIIYSISENLDVDFGLKSWLNKLDTGYSALAGLALRF